METEPLPAPTSHRTRSFCSWSLARVTARISCLVISFLAVAYSSSAMPMMGKFSRLGSQDLMRIRILRAEDSISANPLTSVRVNFSEGSPRSSQR